MAHTMMAKPMTALESHHPIMQFYIVMIICCLVYETNGNGFSRSETISLG